LPIYQSFLFLIGIALFSTLIMEKQSKIGCPNCGEQIDVNEILYHQLEGDFKKKYNARWVAEKKKYEQESIALEAERKKLAKQEKGIAEQIKEGVAENVKKEKSVLEKDLKAKLKEEQEERFALLQKELNEQSDKIKDLNRSKAEVEKLKREKSELKESIEAEAEKQLNIKLQEEKEKIRKNEHERNELVIKEFEKKLADQKVLMEEMQRKHAQGSMQLQGEVQELAIEEWLMSNFPLDAVSEIKKGARGADCLHTVHTRTQQNCGTIYYESKRTKDFQNGWIEKFKNDIRDKGANIGVLVTNAMPSDMERMGLKDGVWICTYEEFKGLSKVLRESIIQISNAVVSQENKGDKMSMLYDFLTSNTFKLQIEAIVEGFTTMKADLESEKRSMQRIWKSREKQIEKVIVNTIDMYGSIKGIAGNAIGVVQALELPGADEEIDE